MTSVVHVELTAHDPAAVVAFYGAVLGRAAEESPFAAGYHVLATDAGDPGVAVMPRAVVDQRTIAWFDVADVTAARAAVVAAGGSLRDEPHEIPGRGLHCYVADPEGTVIGLRQPAG